MDIAFADRDLRDLCNHLARLVARWGQRDGRWIGRRLREMQAAPTLAELLAMPGECGPSGNGDGSWAIRVGNLVTVRFRPNPPCADIRSAGEVKSVTVIAIIDHVNGGDRL